MDGERNKAKWQPYFNPPYLEIISTILKLNKLLITQYYVVVNKYKDASLMMYLSVILPLYIRT